VIVQMGGQTPLKLARRLAAAGVPIIGTSPEAIDAAEDRGRFGALMTELGLAMPEGGIARSGEEAREIASRIGYPVLVRPSYVLGGRAMEIVYDEAGLNTYLANALTAPDLADETTGTVSILVDRFLESAVEVDVDAVYDGEELFVGGILEHIEEAGVHSGDSSLHAPADHAVAGADPTDPRLHARDRPRDRRAWAGQRPVRREGRHDLLHRGQPPRVPHGAVRVQDHRACRWPRSRPGSWRATASSSFGPRAWCRSSTWSMGCACPTSR
jgi:hypothetical protein